MKIRRKTSLLSRFESIYQRLQLDQFRHIIRDNAFSLEYNYLDTPGPRRATAPVPK